MRILNSLVEPRVGGPHLRSLAVAKQLRNRGVETVFLIPNGSDEFTNLASDEGFDVLRPSLPRLYPPRDVIGNSRYLAGFFPAIHRIQDLLDEQNIDIVHASMTLNFQAVLAAYRHSKPLAWFFNDTSTPWPLTTVASQMATSMADEITVAADTVHDHFFSESVQSRTIYPPVNTAEFDPETVDQRDQSLRDKLNVDKSVPVIGTVGNINPIKGHKYLLRAIASVQDQVGRVVVPIVGKVLDTRREYFEELKTLRSELGLDNVVEFLGRRSDIPQLLSQMDVFVLPSIKEACPMSVLEAMAMTKPVVATEVGGVPEQIVNGEHGWLVSPRDPTALATAITDVITTPKEARRRGEAARRRVKDRFSLKRCVDAHYQLYTDLLTTS